VKKLDRFIKLTYSHHGVLNSKRYH